MEHASFMKIPFVLFVASIAVGCASTAAVPAGMPVSRLTAERITLHGVASPSLDNPSCSASAAPRPSHVLHIEDETHASLLLAPPRGEAPLPTTMLHVTHLASNRTWCVMTQADGSPAAIADEFPSGDYAVSVAELRGAQPRKYEVRVQKL